MTEATYNIVMFAYNEQDNIEASITSIYNNINRQLNQFYLIANGCTDKTVETAKSIKSKFGFEQLQIIELTLGDKCNAWNTYVHEMADDVDVHFFTDADVQFSAHCFEKMTDRLTSVDKETVIVAGMPLSGRNVEFTGVS